MNTNRFFYVMCDKKPIGTMVLLKCKNDLYVTLHNIDTLIDIYKINHNKSSLMVFSTVQNGYYYVDKNSLTPYYEKQKQKTLKRIKFDVLLDPRNSRDIDYLKKSAYILLLASLSDDNIFITKF